MQKLSFIISLLLFLTLSSGCATSLTNNSIKGQMQLVKNNYYQFNVPADWNVNKESIGSISFKYGDFPIGGLDVLSYYPDQPESNLLPNHSEVIETKKLQGYSTEVLSKKIKLTQPSASIEQLHLLFLLKDKNLAYDFYFNTANVDEKIALMIIKSFKTNDNQPIIKKIQ